MKYLRVLKNAHQLRLPLRVRRRAWDEGSANQFVALKFWSVTQRSEIRLNE